MESDNNKDVSVTEKDNDLTDTSTNMETGAEAINFATPEDLPTTGFLNKPPLKIGEIYYIHPKTGGKSWILGKLIEIINQNAHQYREPSSRYKVIELKSLQELFRTGKEIAYMNQSDILLEKGTRVLANFREVSLDGKMKRARKAAYSPGIVAEPPTMSNKYRYLIFFDNGNVQYVDYTVVYLIFESSNNVWEDVSGEMQPVIQRYLQKQDCIMMKLARDQTVWVKYNDKWWTCTVIHVDCSLVQLFYDALNHLEWVYRGSDRLKQFIRKDNVVPVRHTRAVSFKSEKHFSLKGRPYEEYKPHICTEDCIRHQHRYLGHFIGKNPLLKPLLCGWVRTEVKQMQSKYIVYKAPCGRSLRKICDVHNYLLITKNDITVDLFDFNPATRCLAEFYTKCKPKLQDFSQGAEEVSIPVNNEMNNKLPNLRKYLVECVPDVNIKANFESDLLSGCKCEDNCADKTKCECWQQTINNIKSLNNSIDVDSVGYKYKRLINSVPTGIYECNSVCQCGPTCLNRVVQLPLSVKLEVFMTPENCWAVRVLNDVPKGNFICCYTGTIMKMISTEQNEKKFSMKLNFLESVEKYKEAHDRSRQIQDRSSDDVGSTSSNSCSWKQAEASSTPRLNQSSEEKPMGNDCDPFKNRNIFGVVKKNNMGETSNRKSLLLNKKSVTHDMKKQEGVQHETNSLWISYLPPEAQDIYSVISDDIFDIGCMMPIRRTMQRRTYSGSKGKKKFEDSSLNLGENSLVPSYLLTQKTFGHYKNSYYIDATKTGNVGKFLHCSGTQNVFMQHVFVNTRDPRFPWVAFFTSHYIRAGTQLVWNQD